MFTISLYGDYKPKRKAKKNDQNRKQEKKK